MIESIWLQPGTRAHMIVDKVTYWEIWTSTDKRTGDSNTWRGTFVMLYPSGLAIQCIREPGDERTIVLREARK